MRARRALALLAGVLLLPVALLAAYAGAAWALSMWPAHADAVASDEVQAYVVSNGVHTDFVFPIRSAQVDWSQVFAPQDFPSLPPDAAWISIGWGDREFYLNTPEWRDLTLARAVGALSGGNRSLLHAAWWRGPELRSGVYRLPLSAAQYASLVAHVKATVAGDGPRAQAVPGRHYGANDGFFEARGSYHAFETCNTWVGRGLREAGVKVSRWTPFEGNVVKHLAPATAVPAHSL